MEEPISHKEKRIRKIIQLYYSRKDIQKAIFDFSKNKEVVPRYFDGFGKRPDSLQYIADIFEMVKKGATSFHCSEEIWKNPFEIKTGMNRTDLNRLRTGWDLLIDIDSRYIDYSRILAELIISFLEFHNIKNIGIKFSGSKGFHILIPWKAFPKEVNNIKTSDMFPEWPRIITRYIMEKTEKKLIDKITELSSTNKYVKNFKASKEVLPDLVLVSSRHLFRTPYSLHEKTALSSVVLDKKELSDFELKKADPMKAQVRDFIPDSQEGEASELLIQALDWNKENNPEEENKKSDFRPIKIGNIQDINFPPCIKNILGGLEDGKKRALFALLNFFRSIGIEREELERRIEDWNKKNNPLLKQGYISSQISWAYKRKPLMPPNCKEFYQGIAVCQPDNLCMKIKNPVNYTIRKSLVAGKRKADKNKKRGKK